MDENWNNYAVDVGVNRNLGATLRVTPAESDSNVAVVEHILPPGKLAAPLHRHTNEDEISYILAGTMGIQEGETVTTVEAGEFAVKERGVWHTFWNPGPEPLRFHEIITPGEFARYFEEADDVLPASGKGDEETRRQLEQLHEKYELAVEDESVPRLLDRHGLEL